MTVKYMYISLTLTALLLSVHHLTAQNFSAGLAPDIPPSPQAVAFNRLGDYQVNNNYGVPDISIPLFEIDFHGFKIPLTLHYEASPLRPGYNYDVTGLGWTLSGNSCVSRTIKGRADEYGLFNNPFTIDPFYNNSGQMLLYMNYANNLDELNYQYDSYNIVLPSGRTIPFYMYKVNGQMTYSLMPLDGQVKISCSCGVNSINSFTVKDERGITYNFTVADKSTNGFENDVNAFRNVTWLLTSIEIPSRGTITYEYTPLQTINTNTVSEPVLRVSRLTSDRPEDIQERRFNVIKTLLSQSPRYQMRFLSRITYGPTNVDFNYSNDGLHMREIVISDYDGTSRKTIRKFTLDINGSALTSLTISGQNEEDRLSYGFTYTSNIPGNYTDYWGNRCESNTHFDLGNFNMYIDRVGLDTTAMKTQLFVDGNPARLIDKKADDLSYYCKIKLQSTTDGETRLPTSPLFHGILTSITYPNGGSTSFTFENHRFPTASAADGDIVFDRRSQRIFEGGGFRIESVVNRAADGTIVSKDFYRYGFTYGDIIQRNFPLPLPDNLDMSQLTFNDTINHHIGCGEAVVDPNILTFMTFSHATDNATQSFLKMVVGQPSSFCNISNNQGYPRWWDACFSANTFRSLLGGRRPVVYPEITVYHGHPYELDECRSKTVYKYDIYNYQLDSYSNYLSSFLQTALPDTAYFESVYYFNDRLGMRCLENPGRRHQLKSKADYSYDPVNHTWNLVSEEKYSYLVENISKNGYVFESDVSRGHCGRHTLQMGAGRPLESIALAEFYQPSTQKMGRSTINWKSTTTLRQGGTRSWHNTQHESYSYQYAGVLMFRKYSDMLKNVYSSYYDKEDLFSYIGESTENTDSVIVAMKSENMLALPVSAETYSVTGEDPSYILAGSKTDYASFGGKYLPSTLYEWNGDVYEESVKVLSYDSYGNPTETVDLRTGDIDTGIHSVYLWDSYGRYMTAMIKNATWSQVQGISSQLSGNSLSRYTVIKNLLPDTQVQTWDYKPLTGVSSHTDASGQTILYEYDGLGRLKFEKRIVNGMSEPELLREYEYNFMNPSL